MEKNTDIETDEDEDDRTENVVNEYKADIGNSENDVDRDDVEDEEYEITKHLCRHYYNWHICSIKFIYTLGTILHL